MCWQQLRFTALSLPGPFQPYFLWVYLCRFQTDHHFVGMERSHFKGWVQKSVSPGETLLIKFHVNIIASPEFTCCVFLDLIRNTNSNVEMVESAFGKCLSESRRKSRAVWLFLGFADGSLVKNPLGDSWCRRHGFDPWVRKIPWRREWQSTPVSLPGKSHEQRSLVGSSPWSCKELDMI